MGLSRVKFGYAYVTRTGFVDTNANLCLMRSRHIVNQYDVVGLTLGVSAIIMRVYPIYMVLSEMSMGPRNLLLALGAGAGKRYRDKRYIFRRFLSSNIVIHRLVDCV